jgi:hypothetical protein
MPSRCFNLIELDQLDAPTGIQALAIWALPVAHYAALAALPDVR